MNNNMNYINQQQKEEKQRVFQIDQLRKLLKSDFKLDQSEHYAEEILLEFGNNFIEELISLSLKFANQRQSQFLECQDIKIALATHWNVNIFHKTHEEFKHTK